MGSARKASRGAKVTSDTPLSFDLDKFSSAMEAIRQPEIPQEIIHDELWAVLAATRGMSHRQVANILGINRETWSRWMKGDDPKTETWVKVRERIADLIKGAE